MSCCNQNINTCQNPCQVTANNTAACETLPSQIENFTTAFFGEITKTEVDGNVQWVLPCNLDVGLENNPRLDGEGLACYFLRLFQDGIIGATGPQGDPGADGETGDNAFTVTLFPFTMPSLASPFVQVTTPGNPAMLPNLNVFIEGAGWFQISATDDAGTLWLILTKAIATAGDTIAAGRLVVPAGYPGASITGATGPTGPTGPQGTPGNSWTETYDQLIYTGGSDYSITGSFAQLNFGLGLMQVLLPDAGTYIVTAQIALKGDATVVSTDVVYFRLRNSTDSTDLDGSVQQTSRIAVDEYRMVTIQSITTTGGAARTVRLQAYCTTSGAVLALAAGTTLSYVRIA